MAMQNYGYAIILTKSWLRHNFDKICAIKGVSVILPYYRIYRYGTANRCTFNDGRCTL